MNIYLTQSHQAEMQISRLPGETRKIGSWLSLAVLLSGNFITILDLFIVNVALPDIQHELHASNAELQLIMVAYSVPYGAMLLNGSRLGDLYGRQRLFLIGMAIFAVGSLLCSFALSPWTLIGSRAIQGVGAALLMPQVYTSLRLLFEGDDRRRAFAIMGAVQGIAGASSQVIGGYLIALNIGDLSWRLVFLVNLPVALYALIAGKWIIQETRAPVAAKLDLYGAILGASALVLLLLPLMIGREHGWPWWSIAGPVFSLPVFIHFVSYEARLMQRGGIPIIDVSLFRKDDFLLGMLASLLFFSTISSFSLSLTILLQIGLGRTALESGAIFVPSAVAFFIGSLLSAPLAKKYGQWALSLGMLVFAAGLLISILVGFSDNLNLGALSASLILNGLGQGIVIPLLLNKILSTVPNDKAGMASGAFSTTQVVGSALGVTIVGIILFSVLEHTGTKPISILSPSSVYGNAFAIATIYNFAAIVIGFALVVRLQRLGQMRS